MTNTRSDGDGPVPLASATALQGATRLYGRGLKHSDLPLYGVVHRAVIELVHGRQPSGLEQSPNSGMLSAEVIETAIPEHPTPGTLSELALDAIPARIHTGQATLEDLRAIGRGHRAIGPDQRYSYRNSSLPLRNPRRTRRTRNRATFGSFGSSQ